MTKDQWTKSLSGILKECLGLEDQLEDINNANKTSSRASLAQTRSELISIEKNIPAGHEYQQIHQLVSAVCTDCTQIQKTLFSDPPKTEGAIKSFQQNIGGLRKHFIAL